MSAASLRATFAEAHRRYTGAINTRFHWMGHLFQGRFGAVVMDEPPAGGGALHHAQPGGRGAGEPCRGLAMVERPRPSRGRGDELATVEPLRAVIPDFAALLAGAHDRTTAGGAGMGRSARAAARPLPFTRQTRSKAARGGGHRERTAAAVRSPVNCHRNAEPLRDARPICEQNLCRSFDFSHLANRYRVDQVS
jgi:hypothetical protein